MARGGSVVPLFPRRDIGELIRRIEDLKTYTDRAGFGSIAYFLEIALSEAKHEQGMEERRRAEKEAKPSDLWGPEG